MTNDEKLFRSIQGVDPDLLVGVLKGEVLSAWDELDIARAELRAARELYSSLYVPEGKPSIIRTNEDGSLDEVFAEPCQFHLEQLAGNHWWLGVNAPDKFYHIHLHSPRSIKANIESEERHSPISGSESK